MIAVSCGIKISAVHHLVLSQYTRLTGLTDIRTDGRTELRQQYRALHYMQSHGKNGGSDPDAVWHHRLDGSRDEAGSGIWGSVQGKEYFWGRI